MLDFIIDKGNDIILLPCFELREQVLYGDNTLPSKIGKKLYKVVNQKNLMKGS